MLDDKNPYSDVCYINMASADECQNLCSLDQLCHYSVFYSKETRQNCFTQLFANDSNPKCLPHSLAAEGVKYQVKGQFNVYLVD